MPKTMDRIQEVRDRAVEIGVYLPLGAYARVRDEIADFRPPRFTKVYSDLVGRGQERLQPIERVVRRRAKAVGRAVDRPATKAVAEVESRVQGATRTVSKTARKTTTKAKAAASETPKLPRVAAPKTAGRLPISGYSSLTASEIATRVRGLTQTELAKVYKFERQNENRSTILEAIESRLVELPIPTYDNLTAEQIIERLEGLSEEELRTIRRYESETKDRSTIIEKAEALLSA
jgi:hypothetical protein